MGSMNLLLKKSLLIIQAFDTQHPQDMVLIPAGEFEMGTDAIQIPELLQSEKQYFPDVEASWFKNESPRHKVRLDAFYMDIYEVSNVQYKKFMDKTGFHPPLYWNTSNFAPNHPVLASVGMMLWSTRSGRVNVYPPKQSGTQHAEDSLKKTSMG